jgi:hypothetical protein
MFPDKVQHLSFVLTGMYGCGENNGAVFVETASRCCIAHVLDPNI